MYNVSGTNDKFFNEFVFHNATTKNKKFNLLNSNKILLLKHPRPLRIHYYSHPFVIALTIRPYHAFAYSSRFVATRAKPVVIGGCC